MTGRIISSNKKELSQRGVRRWQLVPIAGEVTLQEFRRVRKLTQVRAAKTHGISRDGISNSKSPVIFCYSILGQAVESEEMKLAVSG
jgi:hypothetical protein